MSGYGQDAARGLLLSTQARALLEATGEGILALDNRGRCTFANSSARRMLGYETGDLLDANVHALIHHTRPDGTPYPEEECPVYLAFRTGEGCRREDDVFWRKDGSPLPVEYTAHPMIEEGEVTGAVLTFLDIAERKKAEEELRESETFARSALDSLSAHIAILDETGLILATNRAWQAFSAANSPVAADTGTGANYLEVCDSATGEGSEEAAAFARGIRGVIAGRRTSFELEYPCHSPDEKRWFVGRVTHFPEVDPPKIVVAHENVTERKLAEEEIKLRARQQKAVADLGRKALAEPDLSILMQEAVELVTRTLRADLCKVLEMLPGGEAFLLRAGVGWKDGLVGRATVGVGPDSQAGYTLATDGPVVVEDLRTEVRFDGPPLLHEHGVVSGMSTVIRGHERPFGVLGVHTRHRRVFTADDANFLRAVANVLGETIEWRRAEEGRRRTREAERGRMARDLHDGPLQNLTYALAEVQLVQLLSEDPQLERRLEGAVEALKRTGQELRAAVYDLRLEENDAALPRLVKSLVELNRKMSPDCRISLRIADGFPAKPLGEGDSELLRILQEALTNARRHSGARNVRVSLNMDGEVLRAQVQDDGRGFGSGTARGVGLDSMSERARALGGSLKVESEPGKGTTVCFTCTGKEEKREEPERGTPTAGEDGVSGSPTAPAFGRES